MIFTQKIIKELLHTSFTQLEELMVIYELIPTTKCHRRTVCCSLLPEMTLVEAMAAIQHLKDTKPALRDKLFKKIVHYFFLNPVEIVFCPFLDGRDCLIYQHRFFGCRAYGLWSRDYYDKLVEAGCQAKEHIQKQWELLGVILPEIVTHLNVPYCLNVTIDSNALIDDELLLKVSERIETLSEHFSPWHKSFSENYFSDLSFLLTSLAFGVRESVRMKFSLVSEIIISGDRSKADRIVEQVCDPFAEM